MTGCITDTAWIALSYTGTPNSLVATPIVSAIPGNGLQLLTDGIWVPGVDDILGSGFPSSPPDGMLVKTSPIANVTWMFRFNPHSSAVHPWEFAGGGDYYIDVEGAGTINSNQPASSGPGPTYNYGAWQTLSATSTAGPDFTTPFTGVYHVSFGAAINPLAGEEAQAGLSINGADPNSNDTATSGSGGFSSVMRRQEMSLSNGDVLRVQYRGSGGASDGSKHHTYERRWISVIPVRCHGIRAGGTYGGT